MANSSVSVSRAQLIFGICVPLAVLLGYTLAEPQDSGTVAIFVIVLAVLSVPLMMKWYHPILVLSWNAAINPYFLPGQPALWMLVAILGVFFAVLNRAVDPDRRPVKAPSITASLLVLAGVVIATGFLTGGFGSRALGSSTYGGRGYYYILAAILGYFALASQRVPVERAGLYLAMFFLPGLTSMVSNLTYALGPKFYFLYELFPPGMALAQVTTADDLMRQGMERILGLTLASVSVFCFMVARYGVRGILDLTRPWRLLIFLGAAVAGLFGGFRALLPLYVVVFGVLFIMEGLYRTRHVLILAFTFVILATVMIYTTPKLPYSVQRALSFLPIEVDYAAMADAQHSTEWRLEMWQQVLPDVPKYLFRGKGYGIDPQDLYLAQQSMVRGLAKSSEVSWMTGKYHNGLLSLVIPFGIYGLLAFGWFVVAAWRMLYRNHQAGDPRLKTVNTFLLVYFAVKLLLFATVFGSVEDELFFFTGIVGLSLCLNGGAKQESKGAEAPFEALELPSEVRY